MDTLALNIAASISRGFLLGVKTVRGAYIEQERRLASEQGEETHTHTHTHTHATLLVRCSINLSTMTQATRIRYGRPR